MLPHPPHRVGRRISHLQGDRVKILVTGASGFVGSSYIRRMRERSRPDGAEPRRAGLKGGPPPSGKIEALSLGERVWVRGPLLLHGIGRRKLDGPSYSSIDLTRPFDLDFDADVVIHAAARASPWGTRDDYRRQNIDATRHVIDWCLRRPHPPRLVYVSSSSVLYRDGHQLGLTEDSPIGPEFVNDYAASKYAGERLVHDYPGEWTIVRPRAVFGPGDTVLFPRILAAATRGRLPLIDTGGPPAIGDLIYIDTLSDYLHAAATSPHAAGRAFNLTNNQPVEILPFLLDVFDRLGIPRPSRRVSLSTAMRAARVSEAIYRLLRLPGEPPVTRFGVGVFAWSKTFDVSRAVAAFGPPSVTLESGVDRFVTWQKAQ
jgi:2-alkyl-3-oxoalkanoate reductase